MKEEGRSQAYSMEVLFQRSHGGTEATTNILVNTRQSPGYILILGLPNVKQERATYIWTIHM
jgi:hypothetical protein